MVYSASSYITEEGQEFTVNPDLDDTVKTSVPSYQTDPANRAIIHEALRLAGFSGQDVRVAVTLPIGRFFRKGTQPVDEELIAKKRANVLAGIKSAKGEPVACIKACEVYPEAIPALFDVSRKDDGALKKGFSESDKTLIVDIGGTTTDISIITPSGDIQDYSSSPNGVLDIAADFSKLISSELKLHGTMPLSVVDKVLREKRFNGTDVTKHIRRACGKTLSNIVRDLEKSAINPSLLDKVVIVGGGAYLIGQDIAKSLEVEAFIPERPDEAISRGIYKLEVLKHGHADQNNDE